MGLKNIYNSRRMQTYCQKKVKDYFGFALVRTLEPNAIHNFKKYLRDDLRKLNLVDMEFLTA